MTDKPRHYDDAKLQRLVFAEEGSHEYADISGHVESCETCQARLEELTGSPERHQQIGQLLSGYVATDFTRSLEATCASSLSAAESRLDFLSSPKHPEMLGRLGRYEIERFVGAGGMGIVLKGFDTELNRPVAIKTLARHLAHSGSARQRFAREARAAAAIVHENVVAIHNVETDHEFPFLVMQFVAGESLQTRVEKQGPLNPKEVLRIGMQAAAGLEAAHEQGVIHRDVKPANILLENGVDRALLTDFGLARTVDDASLTHTGIVAGTPHYMSPEQADGQGVDYRTDLFSLGSVLYFMATGRPPFRAERPMGVLKRICHDQHRPAWEVNPEIPDTLSDLIDDLLNKKPSRRLADAGMARGRMSRALSELQQPTKSRARRHLHRWCARHRAALITALSVFLVLGGTAIFHILPTSGETQTPTPISDRKHDDETQSELLANIELDREFGVTIQQLERELDALEQGHGGAVFHHADGDWIGEMIQLQQDITVLEQSFNPNESTKEYR